MRTSSSAQIMLQPPPTALQHRHDLHVCLGRSGDSEVYFCTTASLCSVEHVSTNKRSAGLSAGAVNGYEDITEQLPAAKQRKVSAMSS